MGPYGTTWDKKECEEISGYTEIDGMGIQSNTADQGIADDSPMGADLEKWGGCPSPYLK